MAHKGVWEGVGNLATRLEVLAAGERSASVPIYRFIWLLASSFADICRSGEQVPGHAQILTMPHLSSHATPRTMPHLSDEFSSALFPFRTTPGHCWVVPTYLNHVT
jgi:hypothetical protein